MRQTVASLLQGIERYVILHLFYITKLTTRNRTILDTILNICPHLNTMLKYNRKRTCTIWKQTLLYSKSINSITIIIWT